MYKTIRKDQLLVITSEEAAHFVQTAALLYGKVLDIQLLLDQLVKGFINFEPKSEAVILANELLKQGKYFTDRCVSN